MKTYYTILILTIFSLLVVSCSDNTSELTGEWILSSSDYENVIFDPQNAVNESITVESMSNTYVLNIDVENGTWSTSGTYSYSGEYTFGTKILFEGSQDESLEGTLTFDQDNIYSFSTTLFRYKLDEYNENFIQDKPMSFHLTPTDDGLIITKATVSFNNIGVNDVSIWKRK